MNSTKPIDHKSPVQSFVVCSESNDSSFQSPQIAKTYLFTKFANHTTKEEEISSDQQSGLHEILEDQYLVYHREDITRTELDHLLLFTLEVHCIDLCRLSKILHPWLKDFSIHAVASFYSIDQDLDTSEMIAILFQKLWQSILQLDADILNKILQFTMDVDEDLFQLFDQAKNSNYPKVKAKNNTALPNNILGDPHQHIAPDFSKEKLTDDVTHFFSESGALSQYHSRYEPRISQNEMALDVLKTLQQDEILVAEAGTGVGKTLAYLVPGLYWLLGRLGERILLATHTKTLQDQVFYKEIPFLQKSIDKPFRAVLLKGRNNYLCKQQWEIIHSQNPDQFSKSEKEQILYLFNWVKHTQTGDLEENTAFITFNSQSMWSKLNTGDAYCQRNICPYESSCFLQKVRKAARFSDIVVINHSLLFANLNQTNSSLGEIHTLIIDEAHQIEKSASQYLGITLSKGIIAEFLHHLNPSEKKSEGLLHFLQIGIKKSALDESLENQMLAELENIKQSEINLLKKSGLFFREIENEIRNRIRDEKPGFVKIRFTEDDNPFHLHSEQLNVLISAIQQLLNSIKHLFQISTGNNDRFSKQFDTAMNELTGFHENMSILLNSIQHFTDYNEEWVYWCEHKLNYREYTFYSVPIDLSGLLANKLFSNLKRSVLTSATLSIANNFDYVKHRLGLHFLSDEIVKTKHYNSPFLYSEQMKFIVPVYFPAPKQPQYHAQTADMIAQISPKIKKNILVLFTSYTMLEDVYKRISVSMNHAGIPVYAQGIHGGRSRLLEKFMDSKHAILLGTSSFWEGVDIPGDALELLIITKLPFDVPNDPVVQARMEDVERKQGNAFLRFSVPEAIVRFKQGFGRLIRSGSDTGVMILLDNRVYHTQYGRLFLNALPVEPLFCESETTLMDELQNWYR